MLYDEYAAGKNWSSSDFGKSSSQERAYYEMDIAPLGATKGHITTLVEIGFGNGSLLGWAKSKGFTVYGTEIQPLLRDRAAAAGFNVLDDLASMKSSTVDLVVAVDVFEHIEYRELVQECRKIHEILRPGGYLVARFPNGDSPFSMIHQNGDPTHVHAIGAGFARELIRASGLDIISLRAPAEPVQTIKAKLKSGLKRALRKFFSAFVRAAYLGGATPPTFEVNYLLIAQKRS